MKAWWGWVGAGAVLVATCLPMGAEATRPIEQLALARIIVSEAGWRETDDGPAILEVLRDRARKMDISLLAAMRAYSRGTFDKGRQDSRRWVAHLNWTATRPEGWPPNANWEGLYRGFWQQTLVRSGLLLSDERPHCGAGHWAAPHFERPRRLGWQLVDCGNTLNSYYRVKP